MDTAYKTTLELDKVLARAVQLCACQETKEMMQALEPAPTVEDERYDLAQTNAINALLIKNGSPRFGSVHEVRRIVAHARKGGILSMGELLEIAATLRNFSGLSQWYGLSEHEMLPTDDLFFALAPQPVLEKQIAPSGRQIADQRGNTTFPQTFGQLFKYEKFRDALAELSIDGAFEGGGALRIADQRRPGPAAHQPHARPQVRRNTQIVARSFMQRTHSRLAGGVHTGKNFLRLGDSFVIKV